MPANRPNREEEGVVLSDIAELIEQAEKEKGTWPQLGEVSFTDIPPEFPTFAERVSLWTVVGLLGAVTIYAIAKGNDDLLKVILALAAGTLYRLTRLRPEKHGEETDDPRTKRRRKKRTPPE